MEGSARLAAACALLAGLPAVAQERASDADLKSVRAVRVDTPPIIDGKLDDAVWSQANVVTDFHQIRPGDGVEPSEPTELYLLYDDDAFYIGARMFDSNPELIAAPTIRHGQGLGADDRLVVIIDPFNTRRAGYRFETNANGIRHDALYQSVNSFQSDWTVIWDTAATIDENGWVAELEIPFKTLPFDPSIETWGFNFGRGIRRRGEEMAWVSRNRTYNPSIVGLVTGMSGMDQGVGLDVVPSLAVNSSKQFSGPDDAVADFSDGNTKPSLDVFYRLTPSLNAALTINTDFSATEVDNRQVNLTRFNLFFPEKRDFFLNDADLFQFGNIGGNGNSATSRPNRENARPFFSRKIGLSESGSPVDIEYGGRVSGRIGRWNIGTLAIQQDEFQTVDATNLFVSRITANVLEESGLGIIVTDGDPATNVENSTVGADFRYLNSRMPGGRVLESDMWYQRTDTPGLDGDSSAYGFGVSLPNNTGMRAGAALKTVEQDFNPALGFVNRSNIRDFTADVGYTRFFRGSLLQSAFFGIDAEQVRYHDVDLERTLALARLDPAAPQEERDQIAALVDTGLQSEVVVLRLFEVETNRRDGLDFRHTLNKEVVVEPFTIYSDLTRTVQIQPGSYAFDETSIGISTGSQRTFSGGLNYLSGDFYDGKRTNVGGSFRWTASRHFVMSVNYDWNDIALPQGDFITRLVTLSSEVAFSSTLYWISLVQYDNVSEQLGINTRLQWIPKAGREGFIVLNHNLEDKDKDNTFRSTTSDLSVKFKYTFRF
jgi:hypothetical protein